MSNIGLSPVEDYLQLTEKPYCEYRDGVVTAKALPARVHSMIQFAAWGVPFCWVIDPVKRTAWEYHTAGKPVRIAETLHAGGLSVCLKELFAALPAIG